MTNPPEKWLATRTTLLGRLRDWEDESSWTHFFETYGPVIYGVAVKAGLSQQDAEDVVQETIVTVAKHIKEFQYDRGKGSFKSWLLTIGRSKIVDRWRKAQRRPALARIEPREAGETAFLEKLPDPEALAPDQRWEEEWQATLLSTALARLKETANPRHYQVFDCLIKKEWAPAVVAEKMKVNVDQVYVIKQRMTAQLKEEVDRLRAEWEG